MPTLSWIDPLQQFKVPGDQENRQIWFTLMQPFGQLDPSYAGHVQIGDHQLVTAWSARMQAQSFLGIGRRIGRETQFFQHLLFRQTNMLFIVDKKDAQRLVCHQRSACGNGHCRNIRCQQRQIDDRTPSLDPVRWSR